MFRIDSTGSVSSLPTPATPATPGYFTNGDPGTGTPATVVSQDWLNMSQEELMSILTAAGVTESKTTYNQVLSSLNLLYRPKLAANLNLYVATTGSDTANTGLASGSPFATIQHAVSVAQNGYDTQGYSVIINLANGSYAPVVINGGLTGNGRVQLLGTNGSSNVTIAGTNTSAVTVGASANVAVDGVTLTATGSSSGEGTGIYQGSPGSVVTLAGTSPVNFGSCVVAHVIAQCNSEVAFAGNYEISGSSPIHYGSIGGVLSTGSTAFTVTLSGTPAFSSAFAYATGGAALIQISSSVVTFSGSATGSRYAANLNGVINTNGSGSTFYPGSTSGSTSTGGQYA